MPSHCPGCHGHVYDESEYCDEHTLDGAEERTDCPGCQECVRLQGELLSVRESLLRERAGQGKCNSGHVSDRALWDCPVCVEAMRARLAKAERVVKAIEEYNYARADDRRPTWLSVEAALAEWEGENG